MTGVGKSAATLNIPLLDRLRASAGDANLPVTLKQEIAEPVAAYLAHSREPNLCRLARDAHASLAALPAGRNSTQRIHHDIVLGRLPIAPLSPHNRVGAQSEP